MAEVRKSALLARQPSTEQAYRQTLIQSTEAHLDYVRVLANGAFLAGGFRIDHASIERLHELIECMLSVIQTAEVHFEPAMRDALERKELRHQRKSDPKLAAFIDGISGNEVGGTHV